MRNFMTFFQLGIFVLTVGGSLLAANGDHATSASGAAAGMGGTAVGNYTTETEALFRNPANLGTGLKETFAPRLEISASVGKHNSQGAQSIGSSTLPAYTASKDPLTVLPNLVVGMKITEHLNAALGIVSLGGSTIDYSGTGTLSDQKGEQLLYRMTPALAYEVTDWLNLGAGMVVGYTGLALNSSGSTRSMTTAWGLGGIFGATIEATENLRFGASVLTKTKFGFDNLFDLSSMTTSAAATGTLNHVDFQEPAEYSLGVAYDMDNVRLAMDYRFINWHAAMGYRELGWVDQNVIALGVQYKMEALTLRAGAVYGKSPIRDKSGTVGDNASTFQGVPTTEGGVDIANVTGFTAITEWEFDVGTSYQFTPSLSGDFALTYSPSKTVTSSGTSATVGDYIVSSKASEWFVIAGVNYQF